MLGLMGSPDSTTAVVLSAASLPRRTTATLPDRIPVGSFACAQLDEEVPA